MTVEKISAITFRVANMKDSVRFFRDVLGMEIIYGGKIYVSLRSAPRASKTRLSTKRHDPLTAPVDRLAPVAGVSSVSLGLCVAGLLVFPEMWVSYFAWLPSPVLWALRK